MPDAHRLLAAIPAPAILIGPDDDVAAANGPAVDLFPRLKIGEPLWTGVRAPDIFAAASAARQGGRASVEHVERIPVERRYAVEATLEPESGGAVLLLFNDRTAELAAERMRTDFVANASHELRTPLASLIGFIETLQGAARNDANARDRFLGVMSDQARRMARLIDDLLSLSRIEMNRHVPPSAPVNVEGVVREAVDGLRLVARDRQAQLHLKTESGPWTVAGDRDELYRVVENLVENALKYGRDGGRTDVLVGAGASLPGDGRAVKIVVSDDGPGIAPEHLPRLTERFYRVDAKESRQKGGTGLGLALVKHIVGRHRGRLDIASEVGKGSSFSITLPLLR
ncbi:sensor histidine kinase [Terrarubrum flagellatum]|uniref:sensor histidine kinase n=1 Tax=Terrirubrum flagellatum TaxID=2895980 RepID=UPI0031453E66